MTITDEPQAGNETPGYKWVGTRPIRPDGLDKVTGKARFGADLVLPNMIEGAFLRSPHAHARIVSIDTSAAETMPGVQAVITGADFPSPDDMAPGDAFQAMKIMARDKVLFEGHPVAAVAATSRAEAMAAAKAIVVEYEVLPHVGTVGEAMADDAPLLHDTLITSGIDPAPDTPSNIAARNLLERGDLDAGFAAADVIVERTFTNKPVHQGYIEPHAAVADASQNGRANLWCSSQGHFDMRSMTAKVLSCPPSMINVTPAEIGGGFGGKTTIYLEPVAILLSRKANRPVRMVMDRDEVFKATGPTSGAEVRVKMGVTNDGTITAADVWMALEAGAFPGSPMGPATMTALACYDIANFRVEGFDVVCNKPKVAAYRAPGAPISAWGVESVVDELASEIGMDPIELRLKNPAVEGVQAPYGPAFPRIGFVETLEAIRDSDHYRSPVAPGHGRGVACGFWFNIGGNSVATVNVHEDGNVSVITGSPDIGGSRSSMALFVAEELGIDVDRINPQIVDTDTIGHTDVTGGSRVTLSAGKVVVEASRKVKADLCRRAAKAWDCDIDEVEWVQGQAQHISGTESPLSLAAIAKNAGRTGGPISFTHAENVRGAGAGFTTQVVDVEVDEELGHTTIVRYTTAQDAGKAIHPSYVEGQMQGGVVQGIGWALNEEYIHRADGTLDNPSFLDYRIPVASDLPMIETIVVEVPNPAHPYGVRGVGEAGIVPPMAAIGNAIERSTGCRMADLPMSPVRMLEAINERNAAAD
ncbi:MAG: xanthine dehydrogenase family protein molybdopterin-binding subunit [Actinomycetota bacterium]